MLTVFTDNEKYPMYFVVFDIPLYYRLKMVVVYELNCYVKFKIR